MPIPEDREARLRCYRNALRNWNFYGYVWFKPIAEEWLAKELPDYSLREVARELYRYVEGGGEIDEQKETRPNYVSYEFHLGVTGIPRVWNDKIQWRR